MLVNLDKPGLSSQGGLVTLPDASKLKWIFPLIFIHYIVNFDVPMCFSHHSPHPHPSSQLINFPISKQVTAVCDCDKFTSIYVLLKLSLISVVIWLALLRIIENNAYSLDKDSFCYL